MGDFADLRRPFEHVGKLPRITCQKCSKAQGRACDEHQKSKCHECDNWITPKHIHIDYVGHGAVTDRLLEVDPQWTWEPVSGFDPTTGEPRFVRDADGNPVALWINLTVLGVTRPGVGTVNGGKDEAEKELIGDALRNAAMRFGVALDLWIKGDKEAGEGGRDAQVRRQPEPTDWFKENGWTEKAEHDSFMAHAKKDIAEMTDTYRQAAKDAWKDGGLHWPLTKEQADEWDRFLQVLRQRDYETDKVRAGKAKAAAPTGSGDAAGGEPEPEQPSLEDAVGPDASLVKR